MGFFKAVAPQLKPITLACVSTIGSCATTVSVFFDRSKVGRDEAARAFAASIFFTSLDFGNAVEGKLNSNVGRDAGDIANAASRGLTLLTGLEDFNGTSTATTFKGDDEGVEKVKAAVDGAAVGGAVGGEEDSGW